MMRIFIDSNIIIDALVPNRPGNREAKLLLALGRIGEIELWTSPSQWTDLFYILSQGGKRILTAGVKQLLGEVRQSVRICFMGESEMDNALKSDWADFEDAVVYQAALSITPDALITRNKKDFSQSTIPVMDCAEWLDWTHETKGVSYSDIAFAH